MDTSVEYIEMCEKAQEIQEYNYFGNNEENSCVLYSKDYKTTIVHPISVTPKLLDNHFIWLPRQDQLQEMILKENDNLGLPEGRDVSIMLVSNLWHFQREILVGINILTTMEEWWLGLFMHMTYNKRWNPDTKEWEKI